MKTKVRLGCFVVVFLAVVVGGVYLFQLFFGSANYPLRFHKELDGMFGEGRWEQVSVEHGTSSLFKDSYHTDFGVKQEDGRYLTWMVEFIDCHGVRQPFIFSNMTHKMSSFKRSPWSDKYVSDRECLGMDAAVLAENLAAQAIFNDFVVDIFDPQDYQNGYAQMTGRGMLMSFDTVDVPSHDYYTRIITPGAGYDFTSITPQVLFNDPDVDYYASVTLSTYGLDHEGRRDLEDKASQLRAAVLDTYGDSASFALSIYHFSEGQSYTTLYKDASDESLFFFTYRGQELDGVAADGSFEKAVAQSLG